MQRSVNAQGYAVYTLTSYNENRASGIFAKSYTMSSTSTGGTYWPGTEKGRMSVYPKAGLDAHAYVMYWASVMFDGNELGEVRKKNASKVQLALEADLHDRVCCDWKLTGNTNDFRRCDKNGTETNESQFGPWYGTNEKYEGLTDGRRVFDMTRDVNGVFMGVPQYGYALGHRTSYSGSTYIVELLDGERATDTEKRALLIVTTDEKQATLTFSASGGSGAPAQMTGWGSEGTVTWYIPETVPVKTGYIFRGWSLVEGEPPQVQPGGRITLTGNKTLYACWEGIRYSIRYVGGITETAAYGSSVTVKDGIEAGIPIPEGYDAAQWAVTAGGAPVYDAGDTLTVTADLTLYPYYTPQTYAITFDANGGSGAPPGMTKTAFIDVTLPLTVPERAFHTFKGWALSAAGRAVYMPGDTYSGNAPLSLFAAWEENGGFVRAATREGVKKGRAYVKTEDGMKRGRVFVKTENGWRKGV